MKWSESQKDAIERRDVSVVVSAGAGSGKTAVLVERILRLLEDDVALTMDQFLIMTFTEAAADEMRQRIASGIEARIQRFEEADDVAMARRFQSELESLWQAQISTIHSFCLDVVQQNLVFLGLAPDFRLMEDNERKVAFLRAAKDVIEEALAGEGRHRVRDMMVYLRLSDSSLLAQMLIRLAELARSQSDPTDWLRMVSSMYAPARMETDANAFMGAFCLWAKDELETAQVQFESAMRLASLFPELTKYQTWLTEAMCSVQSAQQALSLDSPDIDRAASQVQFFEGRAPSMSLKGPEAEAIKSFRTQGTDAIKAIRPVLSRGRRSLLADLLDLSPHMEALCMLCQAFIDVSMERKRQSAVLDFNDLEHNAYSALSDASSMACSRVKARYRHVFVDEYQDTSPIQDDIVNLITEDNLFAVGDVKQSIYRFRMAEPSLFLHRYHQYGAHQGGESVDLSENYRSRHQIVNFVNFAFAQMFSEMTTGFAYDERARMHSGASYPDVVQTEPVVEVHLLDRSSKLAIAPDAEQADRQEEEAVQRDDEADVSALEREVRIVGRRIVEMMARGMEVYDRKRGQNRPVAFGDIAVLLRSGRDALNTVLGTLSDFGIVASANTSTGFYDALEVKWLVAALSAIDNPLDDVALLTLLRSPLCGWTETLLANVRLTTSSSLWGAIQRAKDGAIDDNEGYDPVQIRGFYDQFRRWRQLSRRLTVLEMLQTISEETDFLRYLDGMTRGAMRRANVERLQQIAARYDDHAGQGGVFGFLENWRSEQEAKLDLGASSQTTKDAVQVMTIHRSKGLEFPVVFVIDLGRQFHVTQDTLYLNRQLGIGAVAYDESTGERWRSMSSIAVSYEERRETLAEEVRILYVACTRARERLILIGSTQNLEDRVQGSLTAHDMTRQTLLTSRFAKAKSYLDWLLPVLVRHPQATTLRQLAGTDRFDGHLFTSEDVQLDVQLYNMTDIANDEIQANSECLPVNWDAALDKVFESYAGKPVIRILDRAEEQSEALFAKVTATDMRRLHVALTKGPQAKAHQRGAESLLEEPQFVREEKLTPREAGVAFHAFMQRFQIPIAPTVESVEAEIQRLLTTGAISVDVAKAIRVADVVSFLQSPLGQRMQKGRRVFREQPFFHRIDVPVEASAVGMVPVVAQGIIDCLVEEEDSWLVVDYKTDKVKRDELTEKAQEYEAQVATYLEALRPLAKNKPVRAFLYFVQVATSVEVQAMSLPDVFVRLMKQTTRNQSEASNV